MIDVVDFFCGCGGTSAGLRDAGLNILAGVDFDKEAGKTFARNFPEALFIGEDIKNLPTNSLENTIEKQRTRPLLFSACAPCQPFSIQKTVRPENDVRVDLLDQFHRFVRMYRPDYIFLENVPGIQKADTSSGPLQRFISLLKNLQYDYDFKISEVQRYGVPQVRKRLVLVASQFKNLKVAPETHGPGCKTEEYETVWNWIGDLPPLEAGSENIQIPNHRAASLSPLNLDRISATPPGGGRLDWPEHLGLNCHKKHSGHTDVYGRLHRDKPAAALSTRCISLSNGRYGHPFQNRAISVREAARLQTFPDSFIFEGNLNSMAKQIGNAVPVQLAKAFGEHFFNHFRSTSSFEGLS